MNSIIFYSILLFIIISIFMPSIYNYAYSSFVGRILILILILYFSKENIFLGLIFVTIVITYSYPLYEGFNMGKISLVTNNPRPVNVNNKDDLFNYYSNFYCDGTKVQGWNSIINDTSKKYTADEVYLANYNLNKYNQLCINNGMYDSNVDQILDDRKPKGVVGFLGSIGGFFSNIFEGSSSSSNNGPIDGCSYKGQSDRYVYYRPDCLLENNNRFMCNDISSGSAVYQSANNTTNNHNLSNTSQQQAQYIINTQKWVC
jgi:hypothetical protein